MAFFIAAGIVSAGIVIFAVLQKNRAKGAALALAALIFASAYFALYDNFAMGGLSKINGYSGEITVMATGYSENMGEYSSFYGKLLSAGEMGKFVVPCDVEISLNDASSHIEPGDVIIIDGDMFRPHSVYDASSAVRYYYSKGIFMKVNEKGGYEISRPQRRPVSVYPAVFAHEIKEALYLNLNEREAGFMNALLLGDKDGISGKTYDDLSRTGTAHVAAVSGMHVSFLVGFLCALFGRLAGSIISIPAILIFILIAGATPSVMRAGIMLIIALIAPYFKRAPDQLTSLSLALFIITVLNPYSAADAGLILSFSAALGMILFSGRILSAVGTRLKSENKIVGAVCRFISASVSSTLSAMIFTVPLTAIFFERISLISPIANVLGIWAISTAFSIGIVLAPLSAAFPNMGFLLCIVRPFVIYFLDLTGKLALLPFASFETNSAYLVIFVIYLYVLFILYLAKKIKDVKPYKLALSVFLIFIISVTFTVRSGKSFTNISIPSGSGGCIIAGNRNAVAVINCGYDSRKRGISDILSEIDNVRGLRKVELLILTDLDQRKSGGAEELIRSANVEELVITGVERSKAEGASEILSAAFENGTRVRYCSSEISFDIGDVGIVSVPGEDRGNVAVKSGDIVAVEVEDGPGFDAMSKYINCCDILIIDSDTAKKTETKKYIDKNPNIRAVVIKNSMFDKGDIPKIDRVINIGTYKAGDIRLAAHKQSNRRALQ